MSKELGTFLQIGGIVLMFVPGFQFFGGLMLLVGGIVQANIAQKELQESLRNNKSKVGGLQGNFRSSQMPIPVIYGRQKIGFNYLYVKSFGDNKEQLVMVGGICEGEIDAIEEVYFGDEVVWRNGVYIDGPYKPTIDFDWRAGTNNQTAFSQVTALDPDFTDCYRNTAVFYLSITYNSSVYQSIPLITFVIRGIKVFDPRSALTAWSQNGPLQWRDATTSQRYGSGVPTSKIDDVALIEAANYCDATSQRGSALAISNEEIGIGTGSLVVAGGGGFNGPPWASYQGTFHWHLNLGGFPLPISPNTFYFSRMGTGADADGGKDSGFGAFSVYEHGNPGGVVVATGGIDYATGLGDLTIDPGYDEYPYFMSCCWITGQRTFAKKLAYAPITPGSVELSVTNVRVKPTSESDLRPAAGVQPEEYTETFTDNGTGVLGGSAGGTGTINYTTGDISVTTATPVKQGEPILVSYSQGSTSSLVKSAVNFFAIEGNPSTDVLRELCMHFLASMLVTEGKIKLRIAKPETPCMDFQSGGKEDSTNNIIDGTFSWRHASMSEIPYRVMAKWVDPIELYRTKDYAVPISANLGGKSEVTLDLVGITSLNVLEPLVLTQRNLATRDVFCSFKTFLPAIQLEPGDVVRVTHPASGWSLKQFRVLNVTYIIESEQVGLDLVDYDATDFVNAPTTTGISTPSPGGVFNPSQTNPTVYDLTLTEFQRVLKDGTRASFIRASWQLPTNYPQLGAVELWINNMSSIDQHDSVYVGESSGTYFEYGPVRDNEYYVVRAIVRSVTGIRWESSARVAYILIAGKTAAPTAPLFDDTASKFTDQCYIYWTPIADTDLGNYELRADLNWGVATNRLYLGKGTHVVYNPLNYGGGASQTFYLKSVDTSGNYSATYDTLALTNTAPTTPTTATDFTGRECYVSWSACPDLDFKEWELRIYSDAGRTTLKRTVVLQQNHYTYRYEDIKTDFGGAGDAQNLYFRLVVKDRYDSTTTVDFAATQATPAILQYDGTGQERVRVGALGSGAYGARFKDSSGNITFEQGDTLKQKYMKLDEMGVIVTEQDIAHPFAFGGQDVAAWRAGSFDGQFFCGARNDNPTFVSYGFVGNSVRAYQELATWWNTGGWTIPPRGVSGYYKSERYYGIAAAKSGSNSMLAFMSINTTTSAGSLSPTTVENVTTREHRTPHLFYHDATYLRCVFIDVTNTRLYWGLINKTTGAWGTSSPYLVTTFTGGNPSDWWIVGFYQDRVHLWNSMTCKLRTYRLSNTNGAIQETYDWSPTFGTVGSATSIMTLKTDGDGQPIANDVYAFIYSYSFDVAYYIDIYSKAGDVLAYLAGRRLDVDSSGVVFCKEYFDDSVSSIFGTSIPVAFSAGETGIGNRTSDRHLAFGKYRYVRSTNVTLQELLSRLNV